MSPDTAGSVGLVGIVAVLAAFIWALVTGQWQALRVGAMLCGYGLALATAVLAVWTLYDLAGRYPVTVEGLVGGAGVEYSDDARPVIGPAARAERYAVRVRYAYEAQGQRYVSVKYAPVAVYMTSDAIARLEQTVRARGATAWVSRWDASDAVLDRMLAGRAVAAAIMAAGAWVLIALVRPS
jgi:hypothetical protein